jgi:hypothetical protein
MWQLADGRLPGHDGSFPPSADSEKRDKDVAEGDMSAQLIWHHDVRTLLSQQFLVQHVRLSLGLLVVQGVKHTFLPYC